MRASEGSVAQAKAALHQAEVNLAYTRILSPTSGVVISRNVDVGQTVAASLQAPTLFVIAEDLSKMQVDTSVAEGDVGRLRDGMKATFTVDAFPDEVFEGRVRQIRNAATTTSNVVTYDAVVDVSNPDLKLRPGMTANVTFIYAEVDDALRVPNAGLRFRPTPSQLAVWGGGAAGGEGREQAGGAKRDGGAGTALAAEPGKGRAPAADEKAAPDRRTVYVSTPAAVRAVRIRTGITDGSYTQVVEGELSPGEQVVTDAPGGGGGRRMTGPRGPL